jgi:hypothetical protein
VNTKVDIWGLYNQFLLSPDTTRLQKIFVRYQILKEALVVPGDVVELGVFKGAGWMFWLKALKILCPNQGRRVLGFDTFDSFSTEHLLDYEIESASHFVNESSYTGVEPEDLHNAARVAGLDGGELIVGNVIDTIPRYVKENPGFRISLLHIDLDTYAGTKCALEQFYDFVSVGGVIILDEYGKRGWGESDAVDAFIRSKGLRVEAIQYSEQPSGLLRKI